MTSHESDFIKAIKRVSVTFLSGLGLLMCGWFWMAYNQTIEDRATKTTEIQFLKRDVSEIKADIKDIKNKFEFKSSFFTDKKQ